MTEMEIEPDGRAANAEPADQDSRDELLGRQRGEIGIEGEHQRAIEARGGEQAKLRGLVGETKHRIGRPQQLARVRLERDGDCRSVEFSRACNCRIDHRAVAAVHAVEIADRRDRATKLRDTRRVIAGTSMGLVGEKGAVIRRGILRCADPAVLRAAKSTLRRRPCRHRDDRLAVQHQLAVDAAPRSAAGRCGPWAPARPPRR